MRKMIIVAFLLFGAPLLHGQVADNTYLRNQGVSTFATGKKMILTGAVTAAAGGGLILLAMSPALNPPMEVGELNENMLQPLTVIFGIGCIIGGAVNLVAGVPVIVAGDSMMHCDGPWREVQYDSRGLGLILEGGYILPDILQARAALGYHFNPQFFLGAGVAPGFWLDPGTRDESVPRLSLPLYADFRWSTSPQMISPYLGLSAGMEMSDISPYLGADVGVRIRRSRTTTRSFWSALSGEVAGGYMRVGIKMGYSF